MRISPAQLYNRLLCIASTNGPPDPGMLSCGMSAVAPVLFKGEAPMRTSHKSQLAKHIVGTYPNIMRKQYNSAGLVGLYDIHRLAWPKVVGVNITAFGRKPTLLFLAPSRFPAFHLKCQSFMRISSWKKCALCASAQHYVELRRLGSQLPVLGKANSL